MIKEGSEDMYYKGSTMLNMIRTMLNDDEKWRGILRGLNKTFYHQTVTYDDIFQDLKWPTQDLFSLAAGVV